MILLFMRKVEAEFTRAFGAWASGGGLARAGISAGAFELKAAAAGRIRKAAVSEAQQLALEAAGSAFGLWYKISDASPGAKPFDGFYLSGESAAGYVVCGWQYGSRGGWRGVIVPVARWRDMAGRSVNWLEALKLSCAAFYLLAGGCVLENVKTPSERRF